MFVRSHLFVLIALSTFGAVGCDEITTTTSPSSTSTLLALQAPAALSIGVGDSAQVKSVAALPDQTFRVVTTSGTWQSSAPAVAAVDTIGIVTGKAPGTATVTVTYEGLTASTAVTVTESGGVATTFSGVVVAPDTRVGTVKISMTAPPLVVGTAYLASGVFSLVGRIDEPTQVVNVTGGGYVFLGRIVGSILSGIFTDAAGTAGGFSALESTHLAVTPYCGTYTSDGQTSLDNSDGGAFALVSRVDGMAAGGGISRDASGQAVLVAGTRSEDSLISDADSGIRGSFSGNVTTGTFQAPSGSRGTFNAGTAACP